MKDQLITLRSQIEARRSDLIKQRKFSAADALKWCLVRMDGLGLLIVEPIPEPQPEEPDNDAE